MNYAEKNLNNGESVVFTAKRSRWAVVPAFIWCIIVLIGVIIANVKLDELTSKAVTEIGNAVSSTFSTVKIILWVVWVLIALLPLVIKIIKLACSCLCITNKRVIGKTGVLKIATLDYPIEKVDNVSLKAGIFGNLFHYHTVTVLGGGGNDAQIKFIGISNATKFKNSITEAIEKHADEARKAQAEEIARAMSVNK